MKCIVSWGVSLEAAESLSQLTGTDLICPEFRRFPNGETGVFISSDLAQYTDAVLLCSLTIPVNDRLVELLLVQDILIRARITTHAVLPWLSYSPQDKIFRPGEPLSSAVVTRIVEAAGFSEITVLDIHSPAVLSGFSIPAHNVIPYDLFSDWFKESGLKNAVCVALDKGGRQRAQAFAAKLDLPLIQLEKSRDRSTGEVSYSAPEGSLSGKTAVAFDDYTGSGSTLVQSAELLKQMGAEHCVYMLTHVFDNGAAERIHSSAVDRVITTNASIRSDLIASEKFSILDIAPLLADILS
ncbi:MAG: Ribose-phosphate pyrophosphokinase [candidate division WS6 bacterium OLB20]|uniref:ribose-phosphate diphosphokinase n=1 Tax=candidate division WS6 bacterium OLB20 TaxID=1617426 RepID=A0A136M067_9BACT|nr:MAG: Ribose-phosphate pyrophosphokinase [candidate division WS6 bacterium OLB20]